MRRRDFIALLGGATATWPLAARAQQPAMPVIGYLAQGTPEWGDALVTAVRQGLREAGLVEGKDFASEFRWANNVTDLLPMLAADLVRRRESGVIADVPQGTLRAISGREQMQQKTYSITSSSAIRSHSLSATALLRVSLRAA
jgi:hypothetical protein